MKFTLLLALVLIPIWLCACGLGSEDSDDKGLAGGTPIDNSTEMEILITVTCDEDLDLTPESGIKVDWMDRERGWTATVDGDEFTLTRRSSCGDECSVTEEIVLVSVDGECPSVVSASSVLREAMTSQGPAEFVTRAMKGTLEIQDWDMESGVLSGRQGSWAAGSIWRSTRRSSRARSRRKR